jgi:predicted peroxiredoxin
MVRSLVVKVTAGVDDPERCNQGFTVAAAGVAAGAPVSLWLTGEAAWLALPERAAELELAFATPLPELIAVVLGGGTITVCSQCAARRGLTEADLVEGATIKGSAVFVEESLAEGAQALVY